jgi:hypothetical protein
MFVRAGAFCWRDSADNPTVAEGVIFGSPVDGLSPVFKTDRERVDRFAQSAAAALAAADRALSRSA